LKAAENYVKKCVTLCQKLGGKTFNLCLFSEEPLISDSNHKYLLREEKRKLISSLIESLRELAKYASNYDIDLLIEPLNRYSTPICTNSEDAKYIVKLIDRENVGIMLDTFHMNIEEDSIYDAIVNSNTMLKHVHVSDNNRNVIGALKRIKYSKFLTFEPSVENTDYENELKLGLQYLKNLSKN
jgi:D-psicose/D-tagatose/L-ribulose 3-epimerase